MRVLSNTDKKYYPVSLHLFLLLRAQQVLLQDWQGLINSMQYFSAGIHNLQTQAGRHTGYHFLFSHPGAGVYSFHSSQLCVRQQNHSQHKLYDLHRVGNGRCGKPIQLQYYLHNVLPFLLHNVPTVLICHHFPIPTGGSLLHFYPVRKQVILH